MFMKLSLTRSRLSMFESNRVNVWPDSNSATAHRFVWPLTSKHYVKNEGNRAAFCWFAGSGGNIDPAALGWIFFSAELQLPDWLLRSEVKQTNLSVKRKHIWNGFVLYKGMHSLLLNCFGDSIILDSPLIQYLCLACSSRWGANEMTKYFKRLLSREWLQQTGRLPQWLLIVCHFKKEAITSSPVGHWESGGWGVMWLSTLSADRFLFISCLPSTENSTRFTLSHAEMSIYLKERCQRFDRWEEDEIFPLADAQSATTHTWCSLYSLKVVLSWMSVSVTYSRPRFKIVRFI